ncbi:MULTISPECIES: DMT family transporter [Halobacterium]|uniref:DMT superfamily transport protein n=4 Tax=Halobacterium salinarum TaxID=2242 RepID=Q9HHP6_HALSA|nr:MULTISPECIES: DMT family transporter [Halobacterium]AAG20930.1 Vng6293c [Halobacterium salinarum NRC-1]MDL0119605.1 DMT family transporter [Halobacterium salinarum]MDL0121218.1 DMT family transporter [Halobacterium salinarum]MDL0124458.1 DMT family transporter [Halobacterium salinarum]MDL0127389.1 DMT family transporter [Halobacterium salinarum]
MSRYRTTGRFLLLCAVWGTAFMATDVGLADLPAVPFAAVRFDIAAALLFAAVFVSDADVYPRTMDDFVYVLVGGTLTIGAHHAFLFTGQQYVTGGVAAVLLGLVPVVTPALTRLVATDEQLTAATAVGVMLGFAGVVIIANPDPTNIADSVLGVSLVLASAFAFAVAAVVTHSRSPSLPFLSTQAWLMATGAVVLHVAVLVLPGQSFAAATWTPSALGALTYLSVVAGVGGFLLYFRLLDDLGPIEMSFIEYVIPVFAALAGWLVLGQEITPATVVGFAFILSGFLASKWRALRLRSVVVTTISSFTGPRDD